MLVEAKADIDATNGKGQTPLHCACQKGWVEIAQYLVNANADINAPSEANNGNGRDGGSPLDIAKRKANSVLLQRRRAAVVRVSYREAVWRWRGGDVRVCCTAPF